MALALRDREAVFHAVAEFDQLGREAFLKKYGFGKAKEYYLRLDGKYYDSKAIAGVAHLYEPSVARALKSVEFTGGEASVQRPLEKLGFTVIRFPKGTLPWSSPLVLVENEVTLDGRYDFWADETGVRYQYPNQYRNKVQTGRPFVYYRGVRRAGRKRGPTEYFGVGTIGEIWRDPEIPEDAPKRGWRWYCAIEDYQSFAAPVPAKRGQEAFEPIMNPLGWRTGVREISWKVYSQVLEAAGLTTDAVPESVAPQKGELKEVTVEDLLVARPKGLSGGGGGREGTRRSTQSKWIGDRAEEAVYHWLKEKLPADQAATLDWHAQRGHTPGYDLSYRDETDQLIGVEVKGTTLARFPSIELTGNEWRAAGDMGNRFRMALVSGVGKADSQIAFLDDPSGLAERGQLTALPNSWRICGVTGRPVDTG